MSAVQTPASSELARDQLIDAYRVMRTIREFEERVHTEFATGDIPSFVHLYAGEEASAAGVCAHLGPSDFVASTHRGHGHAIAKGCDVKAMMAEIFGKRDGLCHGQGGSHAHRRLVEGHARREWNRRWRAGRWCAASV
jgi:acetoin:2,6-dichlorophenolindophenol oxidoreductase subunit alpha